MVIKAEELKKEIEKRLKKYEEDGIEISGRNYPVHIFVKDEDINLFEGFLFAEADKKPELSDLLNYRPPVSGYVGRIGIIIYRNEEVIIKDYRANKQIRKTIAKINDPFLKKLKKALEEPKSENISALFSRSDVIEEFYVLYKKCREFLLWNVTGISEEGRREEFVDNFMMQMLTLWYLQEKGFFNNDRHYFITKFKELKQKKLTGGFGSYYEFLGHFFRQISGYSDEPYAEDDEIGRCVVIGPAVFLNGEDNLAVTIPDKCFYQDGVTEKLINLTPKGRRRMISEEDINFDVPLLNLFESRDWVDGDIDEYVLGSIYEKLITYMERKKLGAFYTPEEITSYICRNTIEPYLADRINEESGKSYKSIDEIINAGVKEDLIKLFELLMKMKILDPAVGSAHFLESAINVLVDIYRKLRDKAEEVGIKKLEILVADEDGKIKPLNLLEIPEKEGLFEVYVKFFIILSRNIYGVDINPSALKVARARLFLTLARHFNVNAGVFIRFPNVHFNLREGNSLIGYVDLPRGKKERPQVTLDFEFEDHEIEYIQERIKVDEELRKYLPEISRSLKIEGDLVKEIQEMNRILSSKKIRWSEFEKVLRTKEKLIQVLVASLNSRYAVKLNKLLKDITELFNHKLDEKFAEEHGIDLEDLKKIKTFHWIFEFPEVFLDRGGFDVVVGNPPHGDILTKHEKEYVRDNSQYSKPNNVAEVFLEKAFNLAKVSGRVGYVIPKSIGFYSQWRGIRKLILYSCLLEGILDIGVGFIGVISEQLGIILKKIPEKLINAPKENVVDIYVAEPLKTPTTNKNIMYKGSVPQRFMQTHDILIFRPINNIEKEILDFITKNTTKFREIYKEAFRGLYIPDKEKEKLKEGDIPWVDKVPHVKRYYISNLQKIKLTNPLWIKKSKAILRPRLFFKVLRGKRIVCFVDEKGSLLATEKLVNVVLPPDSKYDLHALMAIINSPVPSFYIQKMLFSDTTETSRVMDDVYVGEIPIPCEIYNQEALKILVHYLLFLNSSEEKRIKYKYIIKDLEENFLNSLVYELYFLTKFLQNGFDSTLSKDILKHIEPIEYDDWLEYYRKYQVGDLEKEHVKEFEILETNNLRKIIESHKKLSEDNELSEKIKKIKFHIWVDIIERWWK